MRMTGKFIVTEPLAEPEKYNRVWFHLGSGRLMIFDDVRCFGTLEFYEKLDDSKALCKLGIEPFADDLNANYFISQLVSSTREVKSILLDQKIIAGLGNIYVENNGTTISDFRRVDDKTGKFQQFLKVYDKNEQPCPDCGVPIQRIVQQQRSTFFCPECQR